MATIIHGPKHSLIKQSYGCLERKQGHGLPNSLNADGFGLGWYDSLGEEQTASTAHELHRLADDIPETYIDRSEPCLYTSTLPLWSDINITRCFNRVSTNLLFGHVRAASLGSPVTMNNCHPFMFGKYLFMHNGGIVGFSKVKREIINSLKEEVYQTIKGGTDSEHCFAMFLNELPDLHKQLSRRELREAMMRTVHKIEKMMKGKCPAALLSFAVTNGSTIVVTRYSVGTPMFASLYISMGSRFEEVSPRNFKMHDAFKVSSSKAGAVIVSSEPLTTGGTDEWLEVPERSLLCIGGCHHDDRAMFEFFALSEEDEANKPTDPEIRARQCRFAKMLHAELGVMPELTKSRSDSVALLCRASLNIGKTIARRHAVSSEPQTTATSCTPSHDKLHALDWDEDEDENPKFRRLPTFMEVERSITPQRSRSLTSLFTQVEKPLQNLES